MLHCVSEPLVAMRWHGGQRSEVKLHTRARGQNARHVQHAEDTDVGFFAQ